MRAFQQRRCRLFCAFLFKHLPSLGSTPARETHSVFARSVFQEKADHSGCLAFSGSRLALLILAIVDSHSWPSLCVLGTQREHRLPQPGQAYSGLFYDHTSPNSETPRFSTWPGGKWRPGRRQPFGGQALSRPTEQGS